MLPERASLTGYLEEKIRRWPFLRNLRFGLDDQSYPVSDFVLINCALLLDLLKPDATSSVVLGSRAWSAAVLIGTSRRARSSC